MTNEIVARLDAIAAKLDRLIEAFVDAPAKSVEKHKHFERRRMAFWAKLTDEDQRFPGLRSRIETVQGFTTEVANALLDTADMVAVAHYLTKDSKLLLKLAMMEEQALRDEMGRIERRLGLVVLVKS